MKNFSIVHDLNASQIAQLHSLYQKMWWSIGRTMDDISVLMKTSISFGLIENETQNLVGYARVLTDEIKYAFIFDVMALEEYRGKGLGKMIIESIIHHPKLKKISKFELTCKPDMVAFYEKFGFSENYGDDVRPMRYAKK